MRSELDNIEPTQYCALILNPMRSNTEVGCLIGFGTKEDIEAFLKSETVEPYKDPGIHSFSGNSYEWLKTFRKDGPLEWFNPIKDSYLRGPCIRPVSTPDEVEQALAFWRGHPTVDSAGQSLTGEDVSYNIQYWERLKFWQTHFKITKDGLVKTMEFPVTEG